MAAETAAEALYPSVVDRYYQRYTWSSRLKFKRLSGPVRILRHSNRILVSCLHPDHPIRNEVIESVSFKISDKVNHANNKVSGKRKKGGQHLQETAPLLSVKVKGQEDPILLQTGIKGKLIEINQSIVDNPQLLLDESEGRGYIALILPKFDQNGEKDPFTDEHTLDTDRQEAALLGDDDAGRINE